MKVDTKVKRVVLSTSDVQQPVGLHDVKSTGKLEFCNANGYEVFIASTRRDTNLQQDEWWKAMVPPERRFFVPSDGDNDHAFAPGIFRMLRGLYNVLNIPWNETWTGQRRGDFVADATTWMDVLYGLRKHGIQLGSDIRQEMEPNHDD